MPPSQPPQQNNNNNLWDIFSMPVTNTNNAQNNNNMNTFNLIQNNQPPQNAPQPQQNSFGGFDFTNSNIPENKERIDQQNRLSQLENALNSLNMQPQNQGNNFMGNPMMGNMGMGGGMNMNNNMGMNNMNNMNFMNNNNMGMGGGMNMNMNNNMGNNAKPDPFANLTFGSTNKPTNNNFNNQQSANNNPFSFI